MARSTVGVGLVGVAWASGDHDKPQRIDAPAGDWSISLTDACRCGRRGADRRWANTDLSAAGCFRRDPSVRDAALDPGGTTPLACRGRMCCLRRLRPPWLPRRSPFRGSLPHPTQLLCTLGGSLTGSSRNTHYLMGAAPYSGLPEIHPASPTRTAAAEERSKEFGSRLLSRHPVGLRPTDLIRGAGRGPFRRSTNIPWWVRH